MVNENRIVPVTKMDLISLFGSVISLLYALPDLPSTLQLLGTSEIGVFDITAVGGYLLTEPAKIINLPASFSDGAVVFIPGYDFEGFTIAGVKAEYSDEGIIPKSTPNTLYMATIVDGEVGVQEFQLPFAE